MHQTTNEERVIVTLWPTHRIKAERLRSATVRVRLNTPSSYSAEETVGLLEEDGNWVPRHYYSNELSHLLSCDRQYERNLLAKPEGGAAKLRVFVASASQTWTLPRSRTLTTRQNAT